MPNSTPLTLGDVVMPNRISVRSLFIKANGPTITKGLIYTADANGRLIVPVAASSIADLTGGVFQAMETPANATTVEDTDSVQVLQPQSRILLKAQSTLSVGDEVELYCSGATTPVQDTCVAATQPKTKGYLGRITQIYTQSGGVDKKVTATNDLVVVDLGAA